MSGPRHDHGNLNSTFSLQAVCGGTSGAVSVTPAPDHPLHCDGTRAVSPAAIDHRLVGSGLSPPLGTRAASPAAIDHRLVGSDPSPPLGPAAPDDRVDAAPHIHPRGTRAASTAAVEPRLISGVLSSPDTSDIPAALGTRADATPAAATPMPPRGPSSPAVGLETRLAICVEDQVTSVRVLGRCGLSPVLYGGEVPQCLSNYDLDDVITALLGAHYVLGITLYNMRVGNATVEHTRRLICDQFIASAPVPGDRWLLAPLHVRFHWAACFFLPHGDRIVMLVVDSAPSRETRRDMQRIADALGMEMTVITIAQQARDSFECGLFVILAAIIALAALAALRAWALEPRHAPTVVLAPWRAILPSASVPELVAAVDLRAMDPTLVDACTALPAPRGAMTEAGAHPPPAWRHDPYNPHSARTALAAPARGLPSLDDLLRGLVATEAARRAAIAKVAIAALARYRERADATQPAPPPAPAPRPRTRWSIPATSAHVRVAHLPRSPTDARPAQPPPTVFTGGNYRSHRDRAHAARQFKAMEKASRRHAVDRAVALNKFHSMVAALGPLPPDPDGFPTGPPMAPAQQLAAFDGLVPGSRLAIFGRGAIGDAYVWHGILLSRDATSAAVLIDPDTPDDVDDALADAVDVEDRIELFPLDPPYGTVVDVRPDTAAICAGASRRVPVADEPVMSHADVRDAVEGVEPGSVLAATWRHAHDRRVAYQWVGTVESAATDDRGQVVCKVRYTHRRYALPDGSPCDDPLDAVELGDQELFDLPRTPTTGSSSSTLNGLATPRHLHPRRLPPRRPPTVAQPTLHRPRPPPAPPAVPRPRPRHAALSSRRTLTTTPSPTRARLRCLTRVAGECPSPAFRPSGSSSSTTWRRVTP